MLYEFFYLAFKVSLFVLSLYLYFIKRLNNFFFIIFSNNFKNQKILLLTHAPFLKAANPHNISNIIFLNCLKKNFYYFKNIFQSSKTHI